MRLKLAALTEAYAKEICDWKYEGEYSVYNYPEWNKALHEKWAITVEEKRKKEFYAVIDDCHSFCGYLRLQHENEYVLIGVGLKPSLCGQGLGDTLMKIAKRQCKVLYPNEKIVLEVRSFNKRAMKCYQKAGFKTKGSHRKKNTPIGSGEFVRMEYSS